MAVSPSNDRTRELHACCHEIIMGRDPKRIRLTSEQLPDEKPHDKDPFHSFAAPGYLAIDIRNKQHETSNKPIDSWMQAALAMSSSIDEVSSMIRNQAASYVSSTDTFHICFSELSSKEMSNSDRSILETTVASFAAGMAKQIDSLRQTVAVEGDHPFINADYHENEQSSHHWASGPIAHRAGIAMCLMQRLKLEVMESMTTLTMQREGKFKNAEAACRIAQNPFLGFYCGNDRSVPPAPWEIGGHDVEKEERERGQEREEFLDVYCDEGVQRVGLAESIDVLRSNIMPPSSVMQCIDLPKPKTQSKQHTQNSQLVIATKQYQEKQPPKLPTVTMQPTQHVPNDYLVSPYEEEEETTQQLQRESAALIATYQHSDLEGVQKVERSMIEITQLLSRFTDLITEQQEDIFMIHDQAVKSKENVDKGQDQLVDAARRGEKSKHPMASFIVFMAFLLLFFNWILP